MRSTRWLTVSFALLLAACGGSSNSSDAFPSAQCSDGKDNDGDGMVDFPDDLGCTNAGDETEDSLPMPQCADGRDNDGDGKVDYPDDPGCIAMQQDDETDDCPDGPGCPQCGNGKDDDGNGSTDYSGSDPGCTSASDDDEFVHNPAACGGTALAVSLPTTGEAMGMFDTTKTTTTPLGCGLTVPGAMVAVYELYLTKPQVIEASTDDSTTTADTVIDIRTATCADAAAEVACHDDLTSTNKKSKVTVSLAPGLYYILLASKTSAGGNYKLSVKRYAGEGSTCGGPGDCGPGLVCRVPLGQSAMVCSKPMCSDGVDDDADGKNDYPTDPGCTAPDDNDEADTCPGAGPGCPECGDGVDNDSDTKIDYPMDTTCLSAGDSSESCVTTDGVSLLTMPTTAGDTTTANNDVHPSCASTTTHTAPDRTYRLDVPALTSLNLTLTGATFDSVTALYNSTCGGTAIKCSDPYAMAVGAVAAGTYYFVVDGYSTGKGPYNVVVTGTIAGNQSCESPLAQSGALTCAPGFACAGTAGQRTCKPAQCNDGIDNDAPADGKIDYPADPGCTSPSDDTETNPATAPVCANGTDDDTDGLTDWPADYGCAAASSTTEVFCTPEVDATALITAPVTTGTTAGKANNFATATCISSSGPDVGYALSLPVTVQSLVLDTIGSPFDTVLTVRDPQCTMELACDDQGGGANTSKITMTNVAAGNYAVIVDGWLGASGTYTLNVHGTVAAQTACTSSLFTSGVLTCATGTTCTAGKCQ